MIFDRKKFALKYALLYALLISLVMLVPLFVYTQLMLAINEAKTENDLLREARNIIMQMEKFNPSRDKTFHFPRYSSYQAGLYDSNMQNIFTLLKFVPPSFTPGYHKFNEYRYYVMRLPEDRYFGAKYLVISKKENSMEIYLTVLMIIVGIVIMLFLLTWMVFRNFARPFEIINQQLDNFIKDSMHEINTPLSIIQLNADLFARKFGSSKYLTRIKAAAKTLATIYNDMDYLIKKEKLTYEKERIDFSKFLQTQVDYFKEVATLREIEIYTKIDNEVFINFNPTKLQRIVDNTLSNAIKYSHERGKVFVELKKNGTNTIFSIKDEGVGMKEPEKVFERYYREDSFKGGFGIGLNIVKNIADQEGIIIEVDSKLGKGSTFTYIFETL
ncbi:sensor histidine kinase [Hydrogenimonas thermophila]|uniref:histidine kinase n=1 Tax=Hydrogenimonas thermophila TaxID=223786 RepID=A0A1I5PP90_9BACT|nr:HAMP domain-containing sensor histidine kinase [Hydrogenimonas thermophila]SFP35366.1 His Kinase A (phospho-acceptor) domain-containing protein [Hydrogenimonas thermophila]